MKPWYRNSTLQMDDPEMSWLQQQHPGACAVWEWMKCDCRKRDSDAVRVLSEIELEVVSGRLGITSSQFSQISQSLQRVGWVVEGKVKGWKQWQECRTTDEDAERKRGEYWKAKYQALTKAGNGVSPKPPVSPKTSQTSPETRGDSLSDREREMVCAKSGEVVDVSDPPVTGDRPKSLDEVLVEAELRGIPKETATEFFDHYEASGWIKGNGQPVRDWRAQLRAWATRSRAGQFKVNGNGTVRSGSDVSDRIERGNELRVINERLKEMDGNISRDALNQIHWKPGQQEKWNKLKARKRELEAMIVQA